MAKFRSVGCQLPLAIVCLLTAATCSNQSGDSTPPQSAAAAASAASNADRAHAVVGQVPPPTVGMPVVVVLEPQAPREFPPAGPNPYMDQVSLSFIPSVLLVRTGQPTEFRNSDDQLHNVRVREEASKQATFNVAIPTGETYRHTLERGGFYDVGCDIHPGMSAQIFAASTPYTTLADTDGNFVFRDVAPGSYKIVVYAGAQQLERSIEVTGARTEIKLSGE